MKLEVKGLSKEFNNVEVLKNISFTLNEGDIVGLIGANGAGKTTTIKTIFNEYSYNQGEILIDGQPITEENLKAMEFFPDQNNFPKNFKIKDYCWYNYQLTFNKPDRKKFEKIFNEVIEATSLTKEIKYKFSELSSGMQKRALLTKVLITKPKIIFLDEPTSNMDVDTRKSFIELLKDLATNLGLIILITTHSIDELEKFINKLILVDNGQVIYDKVFEPDHDDIHQIYDQAFKDKKTTIDKKLLSEVFKNEKD